MNLPIRTTLEDIRELCRYYVNKPTGATIQEAKTVLDKNRLDGRKITAMKFWSLMEEQDDGKLKLTPEGRRCAKGDQEEKDVLVKVIKEFKYRDGQIYYYPKIRRTMNNKYGVASRHSTICVHLRLREV